MGEREDIEWHREDRAPECGVSEQTAVVVEGGVDVVLRRRRSRLHYQVRGARVGGMQQRECLGCLVDLRTPGSLRCEGQPTHVLSSRIMTTRSL